MIATAQGAKALAKDGKERMPQKTELPMSFTELLEILAGGKKTRQKFSNDFGRDYWVVTYWSRSNYVPAEDWDDLIAFAAQKGVKGVTREYLKSLNPKKYLKSLSTREKKESPKWLDAKMKR